MLDDLQSSVGRVNGPNGHLGHVSSSTTTGGVNMSTTGYREVSRTMTTQATGQLPSTTREYQIEYLSPANSTTTASYEYKSSTGSSANAALLRETADTLSQARAITDLGQSNIAELDTLLDDLNSAQRAGFNREYQITTTTSRDGYQPLPVQHISRSAQRSSQRSYSEQRYGSVNKDRQSPSPGPIRQVGSSSLDRGLTSSNSREVSTSSSGQRPDPPRTPPPHRSPSPVSFPSPPEPLSGYSYRRDEMSSYSNSNTRQRSRSRSPPPRPFPTDHTVYQVDRVERVHREPVLQPRPFPTPSPTFHGDQRPPKELNELMSSFTETDMGHVSVRQHALDLEQRAQRQQQQAPPAPPTPPPARKEEAIVSRNVAGPPVYYPPGVEMFQTREESHAQSAGGGYQGKAKAKYEYKMKQRSKESSKTGKAVVPVCLPLCCAMPCTIM
ncbi:hypothetical protein FOCC_FOCC005598 [Frankliniella occidentalis]|nr:hypothetical protein FOCC_FOCC005598 [Frankliniella occidentalis]